MPTRAGMRLAATRAQNPWSTGAHPRSAALAAVVNLTWLLSGPQEPMALYLLRAGFLALCGGGMLLMGQSLLPDVMEHDFQRTGLRREGLYAGLYSFIEKFAFATAPLIMPAPWLCPVGARSKATV